MSILCAAWQRNRSACWPVGCLLLALGCSDASHRLGGAEGTADALRPFGLCSAGADFELIDDMEDGDGTIDMTAQRGGVWFAFHDKTPDAKQLPASDAETFVMSELVPPRSGSHYAAHTEGAGFAGWGAGIGFELYNQKAYDLSSYAGITFWARGGPTNVAVPRFALTDSATAPRGGQCGQGEDYTLCSDYFGADLSLGTEFQRYSFTWQELEQIGWGEPRPKAVNAAEAYGVRFQIESAKPFDFWIDDIALLCHPD